MNETIKTSIFLALAVVLIGVAALTRPVIPEVKMADMVGKPLFPKFTDPLGVKKLEIVRVDAAGEIDEFRIAEVDGIWSIPSHDNYPADAKDQMGKVAEALVDLNVLEVVASLNESVDATTLHTMYGVIDPTSENASLGEGIGVKIKMSAAADETLVDLIVGKVADAKEKKNPEDPDEPNNKRYVRIAGQVPVYVVEVDPSRFSTTFDQWIEKNLLDISTFDVKEVFVDEYSLKIELEMARSQGALVPREVIIPTFTGDITFGYNGSGTGAEKWSLNKWMGFRGQNFEYYERKMKPDEELNIDTLDGMVSALNDLKIVSVTKKPAALATALREGQSFEKITADPSLKKSGFYLVPMPDLKGGTAGNRVQLLSNEGDLQLRMKDGIRYNLRFGDLTGTESEIVAGDDAGVTSTPTMGSNRYLFITAEFDPSAIAEPAIKELVEEPEAKAEDETDEAFADRVKKIKEGNEAAERSNKRERDRYDTAVAEGKKRAEKLSDRFADWYYVISEDVYKKIHLTESNVFRPKTTSDATDKEHDPETCDDENCEHDHGPKEPTSKPDNLPTLPGMDGMLKDPKLEEN